MGAIDTTRVCPTAGATAISTTTSSDELSALIAAGDLTPTRPTVHELADDPKALTELVARATVGKLALLT